MVVSKQSGRDSIKCMPPRKPCARYAMDWSGPLMYKGMAFTTVYNDVVRQVEQLPLTP